MAKGNLKPIERKSSDWIGLWYKNRMNIYTSPTFAISALKEYKGKISFIVRKNPGYQQGTNRPNMQLKICDSDYADFQSFKVKKAISDKFMNESFIRIEDAIAVARNLLQDFEYGYTYDDLSVEVVGFMERHIVTPEEILDELLEEDGDEDDWY